MANVAMKHIASNFAKLDKFEGVASQRWQKKRHFLLSSMSVVYVLTTPILEDGENATMEQIRKRNKWENDDYVCRGLILNGWERPEHTLKHKKEELTLVELGSHLRIEESLRVQDIDKPKGNNVVGPSVVNMVKHNNSIRLGHVHFKRMQDISKDGLIPAFDMDTEKTELRVLWTVVTLLDPKLKTLGERGIKCIFVGYVEHSKTFRFSSVPKPSQRSLINGTEYIGGSVVPENVTEEVVVQRPKPGLRKSKRNRTPKNFGPKFQLYLVEGTMDEVFDQHSYYFKVEDDPKTFDEAMKSQDIAF
ncbi:hypothetical protein Tco_0794619 [Tanacetum coccineum]